MSRPPLNLFSAFGIELEMMIVHADSLQVLPICDSLLTQAAGLLTGEVEMGPITWSNELALHVLEFKVSEPCTDLSSVAELFQQNVRHANQLLQPLHARLMPTAMHPWMNPHEEMVLWPHDYSPVYAAFDRIFNCSGHGWANLQSTHWNLPFADDAEFAKLHAAIRVVLPLLPALTASSPIYDGQTHGQLDCRLDVYRRNSAKIPSIAGRVVPEAVFSQADYERNIFQRMYRDIAPFDPDGTLQHVWLNARGAIARFDRGAIEIRVLDIQECPAADIALGCFIVATIEALVAGDWSSFEQQAATSTDTLAELLIDVIRAGMEASLPGAVASLFGVPAATNVRQLWSGVLQHTRARSRNLSPEMASLMEAYFQHGCLSERILRSLAGDYSRDNLNRVYRQLCDCLEQGAFFELERTVPATTT